jgi:hypothetical protein
LLLLGTTGASRERETTDEQRDHDAREQALCGVEGRADPDQRWNWNPREVASSNRGHGRM